MRNFEVEIDWRSKHFGLRPKPPRRSVPSDAKEAWDMEIEATIARERQLMADVAAHVRALRERELVERWQPLVEKFGREAVEAVLAHAGQALPPDLDLGEEGETDDGPAT